MSKSKDHKASVENQPGGSEEDHPGPVDDIVKGVSQVFVSALGVGAALTRLAAKSTAPGPLQEAPRDAEPVTAMIHYGAVTLKNVVGMVTSSAQFLKVQATPDGANSAAPTPAATGSPATSKPRVHQGAVLRVPMSIENPGTQALGPIVFLTRDLRCLDNPETGVPLTDESVSFTPTDLIIQPHDFEKLTVFIDVPADATPGAYRALIGSVANNFHTTIEFEVALA